MLSLRNISRGKGSFTLKQVFFDVKAREYLVILGRTGSGKTLLLETIAGLHKHTGSISHSQRDITNIPTEKRKIGFVCQDFALFPHLSVIKNICFPDHYQTQPNTAQWDKLIEFLGLGNLLHRNIHYLSGGEKQRAPIYDLLGRYVERLLQGENYSDNGQNIDLDFFAKNCFM